MFFLFLTLFLTGFIVGRLFQTYKEKKNKQILKQEALNEITTSELRRIIEIRELSSAIKSLS